MIRLRFKSASVVTVSPAINNGSGHSGCLRHPERSGRASVAFLLVLFLLCCVVLVPITRRYLTEQSSKGDIYALDAGSIEDDFSADSVAIRQWHNVPGFEKRLAQFETVFWEPDDTASLRSWLQSQSDLPGSTVLEVGTGTGLVALWCSHLGARRVVATDINPAAVVNAKYNAMRLGVGEVDFRLVAQTDFEQPGAFGAIRADERFEFIISNPPWEDEPVEEIAAYALYDTGFQLLDDLLEHSADHLKPNGKLLLVYGARTAIERIQQRGPELGWKIEVHDDRQLSELDAVFLPGMLLELTRRDD